MDGLKRTDAGWIRSGTNVTFQTGQPVSAWAYRSRLYRAGVRVGVSVSVITTAIGVPVGIIVAPGVMEAGGVGVGSALTLYAGHRVRRVVKRHPIRTRRFRRVYVRPLARTLTRTLSRNGIALPNGTDRWLTVTPELSGLAPRLARPMSPAEIAVRTRYAAYVEPVLRWAPDRVMRGYWWVHGHTGRAQRIANWFRKPTEELGPRVEIRIPDTFVSDDVKKQVKAIVTGKLGLSDLQEHWDQVGDVATGIWTVKDRPPSSAALDDIREAIDACAEPEYVVGLGTGGRIITINLDDDSPHIACSAGSGAGKSVLAMLIAVQVVRKGGKVLILDRKGSHRWALGLPGITYCTRPGDMHAALIGTDNLADSRNSEALEHEEGWDPGPRHFVIFEEMNATVAQLKAWWEENKEKGDPKTSPAIQAFRNLMFMGRSAKTNLFGVAQMLTANTTGGPESRENFGIRMLARYTANNWKMLAPECPMPRKSKVRGRWQLVVAGEATETQVAFLHAHEARELATNGVPVSPLSDTPLFDQGRPVGTSPADTVDGDSLPNPDDGLITLRDAINAGILVGNYEQVKKQLQRAGENAPSPAGARGRANLYRIDDLRVYTERAAAGTMGQ
jgi:hypothetical protein